jgi:hypothetical protein
LTYGQCIFSTEGDQHGDPLGPLLFCLALNKPLKDTRAEWIFGYLDNIGLRDKVERFIKRLISWK